LPCLHPSKGWDEGNSTATLDVTVSIDFPGIMPARKYAHFEAFFEENL
jgi:hypothetical protein